MNKARILNFCCKKRSIFVFALFFSLLLIISKNISFINELELLTEDFRFNIPRAHVKADSNIVLIAIDDNTLQYTKK